MMHTDMYLTITYIYMYIVWGRCSSNLRCFHDAKRFESRACDFFGWQKPTKSACIRLGGGWIIFKVIKKAILLDSLVVVSQTFKNHCWFRKAISTFVSNCCTSWIRELGKTPKMLPSIMDGIAGSLTWFWDTYHPPLQFPDIPCIFLCNAFHQTPISRLRVCFMDLMLQESWS